MRVMITGAAGFVGQALAGAILAEGRLKAADGSYAVVDELVLVDRAFAALGDRYPIELSNGTQIRKVTGDLREGEFVDHLAMLGCDAIFHLAATLTHEAETAPAGAFAVNVESLHRLIRNSVKRSTLVFASSVAVFGGLLPSNVDDSVRPEPQTTYGTHKAIAELLLADYSRKGAVDARALRLPIVLIRPGASIPTVSDQIAAIVREPLLGRNVVSGLRTDTRIPVASAAAVARALIALHNVPAVELPPGRAMNLPSLTISVSEMVEELESYRASREIGDVQFIDDLKLQAIVDGWPTEFSSESASRLGIGADRTFSDIVAAFLKSQIGRI